MPAIVISHNVFEKAAQAQSNALGWPELRVIVYQQPKGQEEDVAGVDAAKQVVDQLINMVQNANL